MNCRTCHVTLAPPFLDLGLQPSGPELVEPGADPMTDRLLPLRVSACARCGLVQLADPMAPTAGFGHGHATAASATLSNHERRWAAELAVELGSGPGRRRILDISCGDGTLLAEIANVLGADRVELIGFERDPRLATIARQNGIRTEPGSFDIDAARRLVTGERWQADLVVMNQALAHTDDPGQLLDAIAGVLAPGGSVAIEAHHLLSVIRDGQVDAVSHAHAVYPSLAALLPILSARGLDVIHARPVDAYGGSIRLLAAGPGSRTHENGTYGTNGTGIGEILSAEMAARLEHPAVLRETGSRALRLAADLHAFLVARREDGTRVVGYGAPARGILLLNLARVDPTLLAFTVDRNPAKQGRTLAGSRIPVLSPEHLKSARPDYVLVLPWTLLPEIAAQLAPFREMGTKLVVAMPELTVIDR